MRKKRRYVVSDTGEKYPFSRGVLVKSLMKLGLSIDDAYAVADKVAKTFKDEITLKELSKRVYRELKESYGAEIARKYRNYLKNKEILVEEDNCRASVPFSKGILANSIRSAGLDTAEAFQIAKSVEKVLRLSGKQSVKRKEIRSLVERILTERYGREVAARYLVWRKLKNLKKPIIILISGATGVGKSKLAAELTTIFDINRMVSTDSVREVMRKMISRDLVPSIHVSSYEAGKVIYRFGEMSREEKIIYGYLDQSEKVLTGVQAIIDRAIKENVSLIVEGIHLIPGAFKESKEIRKAHIVPILLTTLDEDIHKSRFKTREKVSQRTSKKYLKNFRSIRLIQDYLYKLAKEEGIPIIDNIDFDQSRQKAIEVITDRLLGEVEMS
ncbi:ATP cone domain-containing protein [Desulfurobacterium sp.]